MLICRHQPEDLAAGYSCFTLYHLSIVVVRTARSKTIVVYVFGLFGRGSAGWRTDLYTSLVFERSSDETAVRCRNLPPIIAGDRWWRLRSIIIPGDREPQLREGLTRVLRAQAYALAHRHTQAEWNFFMLFVHRQWDRRTARPTDRNPGVRRAVYAANCEVSFEASFVAHKWVKHNLFYFQIRLSSIGWWGTLFNFSSSSFSLNREMALTLRDDRKLL